jgi:hypothetical protein
MEKGREIMTLDKKGELTRVKKHAAISTMPNKIEQTLKEAKTGLKSGRVTSRKKQTRNSPMGFRFHFLLPFQLHYEPCLMRSLPTHWSSLVSIPTQLFFAQ